MSETPSTQLLFRRGTYSEWSAANPILASGEPAYDTTNKTVKIGDGSRNWDALPTINSSDTQPVLDAYPSADVSGVYNMVVVSSATYTHLTSNNLTDPNTIYFVP